MRDLLGPQKTCISLFRPYRSNQLPRLILFLSKINYVYIRLYYPLPCCFRSFFLRVRNFS